MKTLTNALLFASALGLAAAASAAPAPPPAGPTPEQRAERLERMRETGEQMKKELGLSESQAAAVRTENQRYMGVLQTARAEHRAALSKILTPEQMAKLDAMMKERREDRMEAASEGKDKR